MTVNVMQKNGRLIEIHSDVDIATVCVVGAWQICQTRELINGYGKNEIVSTLQWRTKQRAKSCAHHIHLGNRIQ